MANLSQRLQELKHNRGILQKDIASSCNISLRMYQYYEKGLKEATQENLIAIAEYFNVSVDYLLGRTDNPEVNK